MKSYEELLEKAYAEMPEEVIRRERFEIPEVNVQREGNRTIIKNFSQIVKVLNRSEEHFFKYLVKSLGTAGFLESGRVILQGKFTREEIQDELNSYVKEYVICKECQAPDTEFVKEERVLFLRCLACGAKHPVRNI
ncbi:translation initiation factor 2 subunit beta (aeIF-2b) [Archaeoglobus sulfaticallidus PM70-1]|uniref:Translation initiation factor 2 subunit beta n=1 Tax=Archaeoglobus sulfaticallidus PM70-1 TaxID=387631 RepID=N0BEF4_9EURY|nr:translation initiation factor IF-2 subunit beta [Archaeoglobus sulfaticallidus]AGK60637.1 translation initiation factor 2 subunit beta (aeIF-2b) [Archaeoglobus sulfaticallidus PM70-1]